MPVLRLSLASAVTQAAGALMLILGGCSRSSTGVNWDPPAAAHYLDNRASSWMHSRKASRDHGTACLSCHTTVPYALARSELGRMLDEPAPPPAQRELLAIVKKRIALWPQLLPWYRDEKHESRGTEAVLNALILTNADATLGHLSAPTRAALDDMWTLQQTDGPRAGSWPWIDFGNQPWEASDSVYYGATLAALATGFTPEEYRSQPDIQERVRQMRDYLRREYPNQTLLNRVNLLWAAERLPNLIEPEVRTAILSEISARQRPDGGWSVASLMPGWKRHDGSSPPDTSDGYATGLITLVLQESGIPTSDPRLGRSLAWLLGNQSHWNGRWSAESPNGRRRPWDEAAPFMDDAATAFAVLALARAQTKVVVAGMHAD
jgi:squalene-hopene/tetraprenyl-beta-curcumene cyclase